MAQPVVPPHLQSAAQVRMRGVPVDENEQAPTENTPAPLANGPGQNQYSPQPASSWHDSSHTTHTGHQEHDHNQINPQRSHSPFLPPFLHPNLAHLMQQTHMQQMMHYQQHGQLHEPGKAPPGLSNDSIEGRNIHQGGALEQWHLQQQQQQQQSVSDREDKDLSVLAGSATPDHGTQDGTQQAGERLQFPTDRHSIDAQLRQGMLHPLAQHPQPMFNLAGNPGPPGFEADFGPPGMIPMHTPNGIMFVPMNRVTPPPPGGGAVESSTASGGATLDGPRLTVQEIEEAQVKDLQGQFRRFSLGDPVSPPRSRSIPSVADHISGNESGIHTNPSSHSPASSRPLSSMVHSRFQDPSTTRYEEPVDKVPFSVKDIDFYSDRKYDPYRPTNFDQITKNAKEFCQELMPKPEEETRKLALLQKLSDIAVEVFGEAEVLPFGSSGNGLALANADMDVCVFLSPKEGAEEVSPVEFVERIGDRLEKDPDFENILQLKRARVPIVKLNHVNGIACDIGYQNDLAIWNTRLLRAYCRIDERVRDMVVIIKIWAKRRKINNPYTGSLSSYAYVLLVIHVLQRRGVLPNLQSIVAGNGKVPFWDCQGFNRYFFEDIANLSYYWQPTPESKRQSVGELLYEFFRYYASEFRYANHVVSIRSGGLLTKEAKEWTKDHTQPPQQQHQQQPQQQPQQQQQAPAPTPEATEEDTEQAQATPAVDSKPVVKNRYLFCIEDPFELDHNVGRPVDRYSLFTIRGEFMRAAKILSRKGDGIISRLCVEREVPVHQDRNRNGSVDQGDDQSKDKQGSSSPDNKPGPRTSFSTGEEGPRVGFQDAESGNDNGGRRSSGRRNYYKRATIGSEPRHFNRS
ncbi:hypothetical protein EC991_011135 [Linnemannia zychae]|nr:hypothetical protein EC991_011135 [Linnemannia zychae]